MIRLLALAAVALLLTGCQATADTPPSTLTPAGSISMDTSSESSINRSFDAAPGILPDDQIKQKAIVMQTTKGEIRFNLFADEAPLAVSNFVFLTSKQFYDGLTFHRVEPNFVIQGGDPDGTGRGGPGYEFNNDPVNRSYSRGIVAMANAGVDTNGSQFFIMLKDTPLPPSYSIFGEVTSGMEVVDQIRVGDKMTSVTIVPVSE